jgi:hypothetical protein
MSTKVTSVIDNATLSGVERLMGRVGINNMANVENDILCLEKLLTAILFSDNIISIDYYKQAYKSMRIRGFDFIDFKKLPDEQYKALVSDAASFARSLAFEFDGSKPAGDIVSFFEALRLNPQLRWDIFVSSEYLTLSLLVQSVEDVRYETAIDAIFRNESTNAQDVGGGSGVIPSVSVRGTDSVTDVRSLVNFFASNNPRFAGVGHKDMLKRFLFGYGWAAERTYFYNSVASQFGADTYLAPLRDAFCEGTCRISAGTQVTNMIERLKSTSQEALVRIVDGSGNSKFVMKLPFFTAYFISRAQNPEGCINLALEARNAREFKDCRIILQNLRHLSTSDRYSEINKILDLLNKYTTSLMNKFGVSTANGPQVSISLGIAGANFDVKLDRLFYAYRNRPFARLFRNLAQDMLNIERLGGLYEKLTSSIVRVGDTYSSDISSTPRYMEFKDGQYSRPVEK